jgi:hypothetical protein
MSRPSKRKTAPRPAVEKKAFVVLTEERHGAAQCALEEARAILNLAMSDMHDEDTDATVALYAVRKLLDSAEESLYVPFIHHEGEPVSEKTGASQKAEVQS